MAPAAVICGKLLPMIQHLIQHLPPKIDVVHVCTNRDAACAEIPALLEGASAVQPSSGLGSNTARSDIRHDIAMIIVGAGYTAEDFEAIKAAADGVKALPIFWADISKVPAGAPPPPPDVIQTRLLQCLAAHEKADGVVEPDVYRY